MIIDNHLLDTLSAQAKTSPRLRKNYDLRNSENDNSQRMLNGARAMVFMCIRMIQINSNMTQINNYIRICYL